MSKWIAEFELEDGDTMPEHMDLEYKGVRIDFHCKPQEPTTKNDLGVDCISRQATINAVKRIHPVDTDYDCTLYDKVDVMYVLYEMPSVTPQEPTTKNNLAVEHHKQNIQTYAHDFGVSEEQAETELRVTKKRQKVRDK